MGDNPSSGIQWERALTRAIHCSMAASQFFNGQRPRHDLRRQQRGRLSLGRVVGEFLIQRKIAEPPLPPDHHAACVVVEEHFLRLAEIVGEHLLQPPFLDGGGETQERVEFVAALLYLAHLRGDDQTRPADGALPREHTAPVADELATQRALVQPPRELVGKPREHATPDVVRTIPAMILLCVVAAAVFVFDFEELREEFAGLSGSLRVDAQPSAAAGIKAPVFREAERPHQQKEIRLMLGSQQVVAFLVHLAALAAGEKVPGLGQGGKQRDRTHAVAFAGGEEHPGVAGMDREGEHLPADGAHLPREAVERAEVAQKEFGAVERAGVRAVRASGRRGCPPRRWP